MLLIAFFFVIPHHSQDDKIDRVISNMTSDEKEALDYFFRELLLHEGGAYVLKGSKPTALGDFFFPTLREIYFFGIQSFKKGVLLKKGFKTWKKYESSFPFIHYSLICSEDSENEIYRVLLINKKSFVKEVSKHLDDFRDFLGVDATPERILENLIHEDHFYRKLFNDHSGLTGILLGFGKHNSQLFYRRDSLWNSLDLTTPNLRRPDLIEKELRTVNEQLQFSYCEKNPLIFAKVPYFLFDPNDVETQELLQRHLQQRKEFTQQCQNGNFLKTALRQLCS